MTTFVARVAAEQAVLGPGSPHEAEVKAGTVIAVGIGSAMFDPGVFPDPDGFHVRRRTAYLHTGFGPHECLGQFVAYAIIPETIRQILLLPGIRLRDGDGSRVDNAGGPVRRAFRARPWLSATAAPTGSATASRTRCSAACARSGRSSTAPPASPASSTASSWTTRSRSSRPGRYASAPWRTTRAGPRSTTAPGSPAIFRPRRKPTCHHSETWRSFTGSAPTARASRPAPPCCSRPSPSGSPTAS